jgi:hypothetical protein
MKQPFGVMNRLSIASFATGEEAAAGGYDYKGRNMKPLEIEKAVVVQKGTKEGNPTVDFIMVDAEGNKYVLMITGHLLRCLPI